MGDVVLQGKLSAQETYLAKWSYNDFSFHDVEYQFPWDPQSSLVFPAKINDIELCI